MSLLHYLASVITISESLEKEIDAISTSISIKKGGLLIRKDERCQSLFFITKGLVRGYYFKEGKEITNWFAQEQEFATCFYAFISQSPSFEFIEAIEDSELVKIDYKGLQNLYKHFSQTERIGRIITETYYIKLEERILNLQFKTAKERYQTFVEKRPSLLQRASLGQIAAYLGITQETLSRIRTEV